MLDNFNGEGLKTAAASLKQQWKGSKQVLLECSGGLTESNVAEYINNGNVHSEVILWYILTSVQISTSFRQVLSIKAFHTLISP
jgi:nicotinate-nucleotide pyrophosphorylase